MCVCAGSTGDAYKVPPGSPATAVDKSYTNNSTNTGTQTSTLSIDVDFYHLSFVYNGQWTWELK